MRILFDNGSPRQLRRQLFGHEIETAMERGWATLANGVLLDRAEEAGYDGLYRKVGPRKIARFIIEEILRPHVVDADLEPAYEEMARNEDRERDAEEWSEVLLAT